MNNFHSTKLAALALLAAGGVFAADPVPRNGEIHVTKECSQNHGNPGDFCTITSSNLPQLPVGSRVYYTQAAGIPNGVLDSNVALDAGDGNRAVGRCTLPFYSLVGVCTFEDGIGLFAGFSARVVVDCRSGCHWDGTYAYRPLNQNP